MSLESELQSELKAQGADFVHFVDISQLSNKQNKSYPNAILIGIILSQDFIKKATNTPDYVQNMIRNKQTNDEFHQKETHTDKLADTIADYLTSKGYSAYSQSEDNIESTGFYDKKTKTTPLPHKTIAVLAGLGWIGKHNLLVTPEYGSAISMCTVLTDAPLKTVFHTPAKSRCGDCEICKDICSVKVIKGKTWSADTSRDELVDVYKCTTCLECLVFCPWTQTYMKKI
ncbi:epoxyqueuosine reductase [candidate division KSB1 bacterium]|nr:epoxyqueuosine reductase [candidate division KSB1 bacterium]